MRYLFPALILGLTLTILPVPVQAASASFFGPIVPPECNCANVNGVATAPSYGCVLATIQNVINFGISLGLIAFTLMLAYVGFNWMLNASKPEARSESRNMLLNVFIGLFILLSAWLVVDFIMKSLYKGDNGSADYLPWNSILSGSQSDQCIQPSKPSKLGGLLGTGLTTELGGTGGQLNPNTPASSGGLTGTTFTFDPGIEQQKKYASARLSSLLTCMAGRLPSGVGKISSIADSAIANGTKSFAQCAAGQCQHAQNSCHYGGKSCVGESYAVDFGDGDPQHPDNLSALKAAASTCGADFMTDNEGGVRTHLHVSVGATCGCN